MVKGDASNQAFRSNSQRILVLHRQNDGNLWMQKGSDRLSHCTNYLAVGDAGVGIVSMRIAGRHQGEETVSWAAIVFLPTNTQFYEFQLAFTAFSWFPFLGLFFHRVLSASRER
jgi:hypothetical protein